MRKVNITHWDLDGVSSYIILNSVFNFDISLKGGYHREEEMSNKVKAGDSVVVSDYAISEKSLNELKEKTNNRIIVIDHHPETKKLKEAYPNDMIYYDKSKSASLLCFNLLNNKGKKFSSEMADLVKYANAYDLFKRKEEPENFSIGYDLNLLFWNYKFDEFFSRFEKGFDGFNEKEIEFLTKTKEEYNKKLESAIYHPLKGDNIESMVVFCSDGAITNDIPYFKTGYDVYFIITRYKTSVSISLRSGESSTIVNSYCSEIEKEEYVINSGGHPQACGITIKPNTPDEEAMKIIMKYHNYLDRGINM